MRRSGKLYIGTSGWHYKHWKNKFYPAEIGDRDQLEYYSRQFNSVEINNTFYNLPLVTTFSQWKDKVPEGFLFAIKASRFITHMKKLNVGKAELNKLFNRIKKLGKKTGPVLFQLPPLWKLNIERFESFLKKLPDGYQYAFEFRNDSWYDENVYELLNKYKCAFCIYELAGHTSPKIVTGGIIYIRLHGPGDKYQGKYKISELKKWLRFVKEHWKSTTSIYIYFDNDQNAYAAENAKQMNALFSKK
jgi:uncharacterized protein YecE (DUF72 family)